MNRLSILLAPALLGACTTHPGVSPWDPPADLADQAPRPDFVVSWPDPGSVKHELPTCGGQEFQLERGGAQLLMVLDRSTSMTAKWSDFTGALLETVEETEAAVMWGLMTFPGANLRACRVSEQLVPVASSNHAALTEAFARLKPGSASGSPARAAIRRGTAHLEALPAKTPRYLVLATDGAPNCRDDVQTAALDLEPSLQAVREAAGKGFHTFVVDIAADKEAEGVLSDLADAGLEAQPGTTRYFHASNRKELTNVLRTIARRVQGCVFPLEARPPAPDLVFVTVDGVPVARDRDQREGWSYEPGGASIRFHGQLCARLVQPELPARVKIVFGCPERYIP